MYSRTTGRKTRRPYLDIINASAPFGMRMSQLEDEKKAAKKRHALNESIFAHTKTSTQDKLALDKKIADKEAKQTDTSNLIAGGSAAILGAYGASESGLLGTAAGSALPYVGLGAAILADELYARNTAGTKDDPDAAWAMNNRGMRYGGLTPGQTAFVEKKGWDKELKYLSNPFNSSKVDEGFNKLEEKWGHEMAKTIPQFMGGTGKDPGSKLSDEIHNEAADVLGIDVEDDCIITTTATNPYSYEVNTTREYRDRYLSQQTLRGYYMVAETIVPLMRKSGKFKKFIKKCLVDAGVKYCEWMMGKRKKKPVLSSLITTTFLKHCDKVGSRVKSFIRSNGEVW